MERPASHQPPSPKARSSPSTLPEVVHLLSLEESMVREVPACLLSFLQSSEVIALAAGPTSAMTE